MMDQDEVDAYDEWKLAKLTGGTDISVAAYNREVEGHALAYERGVGDALAATHYVDSEGGASLKDQLIADNPYRKPGMLGHTKTKRITT